MEVTLKDLLDSREQRVWHQQELLKKYGGALVSVTLNIPGPIKDREEYRKVMDWGMEQLLKELENVAFSEVKYLKTGAEGYISVQNMDALELKKIAIKHENLEPKSRLLDIDVMTQDGGISRSALGVAPRRCLLCEENAKACARSQKHSMEELLKRVDLLCKI